MRILKNFLTALSFFCIVSCQKQVITPNAVKPTHVLEGGWLAADGTVFLFRPDGTFHGYDFRHNEIWGNWVTLSDTRIGFQSLLRDSYYTPQYAIIDPADKEQMDYIVTGGTSFIDAKKILVKDAEAAIEIVVKQRIYYPEKDDAE